MMNKKNTPHWLSNFKKVIRYYSPIIILVGMVAYALQEMPKMIVQGEGFIWLSKGAHDPFWNSIPRSFANFEVSAVLAGTLLSNLFGLNLHMYYWVWFLLMLVISVLFFLMVLSLTKNRLISFSASLIFSVNYVAQWGMLGWTYTSFLERTITVLLLIPSFLFLHRYLENKLFRDYLISIVLFFLGIGIGQWGLIFAGAYIVYPVFWSLFKDKAKRLWIKRILIGGSFLLISIFFLQLHYINQSNIGPRHSFSYFLLHPEKFNYMEQVSIQLTRWSQYPVLLEGMNLKGIINHKPFFTGSPIQYFGDGKGGKAINFQIIVAYFIVVLIIYLRLPVFRPLLLTIILGIFSIFLVNIYFGRYFPEDQPGASRYLYLPTIWLSIFWSLFLWAVFWSWNRETVLFFLGTFILLGYYLINSWMLSLSFQSWMYSKNSTYLGTKSLFSYIETLRPTLKPNTLVITPWDEMGCGETVFLNDQIGRIGVKFMPEFNNCAPEGGWQKIASSSASVIKIKYDKDCQCVVEEKIK